MRDVSFIIEAVSPDDDRSTEDLLSLIIGALSVEGIEVEGITVHDPEAPDGE